MVRRALTFTLQDDGGNSENGARDKKVGRFCGSARPKYRCLRPSSPSSSKHSEGTGPQAEDRGRIGQPLISIYVLPKVQSSNVIIFSSKGQQNVQITELKEPNRVDRFSLSGLGNRLRRATKGPKVTQTLNRSVRAAGACCCHCNTLLLRRLDRTGSVSSRGASPPSLLTLHTQRLVFFTH